MIREKTCTFTGNRPNKLPWGEDETDFRCTAVKQRIREELIASIADGYDTFVCGMAQGGDTYFAEEVLSLKKSHDIKLICAIPCPEQAKGWADRARMRYDTILYLADEQVMVSEHYSRWCMHKRNQFMVNASSKILVLDYDGVDGGTVYTKKLAQKQNLLVVELS